MKTTDIISVNPSKSTLGDKNNLVETGILRTNILSENINSKDIDLTNILFSTSLPSKFNLNQYLVPLRTIFGTLMIIAGIFNIEGAFHFNQPIALSIIEIVLGAFLSVGFLTKFSMGAGAVIYGILAIMTMRGGMIDLSAFLLCLGCVTFFLLGCGKYSCDYFIYSRLRKNKAQRLRKDFPSYKAFDYATRRI